MHANSLKLGLVAAFFVVNAGAQGEEVDDLSQYPSSPAFDANADWHRNVDQHEIRLSYFLDGDRRVAMRCVANLASYQVETHREVHDHATQASKTRRLSHAQVLTLRELTRHLSASDAKPELANLLTVSLVEGETRRVITFDATKPPAALIRLYDLTGAYLPAAVEFRFDPMPQVKDGANSNQRDDRVRSIRHFPRVWGDVGTGGPLEAETERVHAERSGDSANAASRLDAGNASVDGRASRHFLAT